MRQYVVNGFAFYTQEEAKQAELEAKRVDYMQERMDYDKPMRVLMIYNKAINEQIFRGQIGITYLRKLQEYLQEQADVPKEQILAIPVEENSEIISKSTNKPKISAGKQMGKRDGNSQILKFSIIMNIALVIAVITMFVIALTSDRPNILNYEQNLQNKYAGWEQELREREKEINQKWND